VEIAEFDGYAARASNPLLQVRHTRQCTPHRCTVDHEGVSQSTAKLRTQRRRQTFPQFDARLFSEATAQNFELAQVLVHENRELVRAPCNQLLSDRRTVAWPDWAGRFPTRKRVTASLPDFKV
jgi:hypothetical protein